MRRYGYRVDERTRVRLPRPRRRYRRLRYVWLWPGDPALGRREDGWTTMLPYVSLGPGEYAEDDLRRIRHGWGRLAPTVSRRSRGVGA